MKSSRWAALAVSSCALAAALGLACAAQAAPGDDARAPTEVVRFADLNLDTSAGVRVLYRRMQRAARDVCEPLKPAGSAFGSAAWRGCIARALSNAVRRVDRPLLTAYHERQVGHVMASARALVTARE